MSEVSATLVRLIDVAERTLCCRQRLFPAAFDELVAEVNALQPPVGAMLSDAPSILVSVLAAFWGAPESAQQGLWLNAVAALLRLVRSDLSHVIEARKRPLESDAYRTGGGMPRDRYPSARG